MPVATSTEQLDTMYTTTWYLRRKEVVDQVMEATPFWYMLTKKGRQKSETGGRQIEEDLRIEKNETVQFIGRGQSVTLADTDQLTVSKWDWKYLTGHIMRFFADTQKNRGKAQIISKVNSDIDTLRDSMIDLMETRLYSDGTDDGGKSIDGLANIIAAAPGTGTVGGIDRSVYTWWRNQYYSMAALSTSVHLRKRMNIMFNNCGQFGQGVSRFPDIVICDQASYEFYDEQCAEIGRIMMGDKKLADLGFGDLAFRGRPITWSPSCPATYMYFINTAMLHWVYDPIENFGLGEWLPIVNQPRDRVVHAMSVGNLTSAACNRLGVLFGVGTVA